KRRFFLFDSAFTHFREDREVHEVHRAEDKEHNADFAAQNFEGISEVLRFGAILQSEADITNVDEIKTDEQEMIDGVSQGFVAVKAIDETDAAVFVESPCDPGRESDADGEIGQVSEEGSIHIWTFLVL